MINLQSTVSLYIICFLSSTISVYLFSKINKKLGIVGIDINKISKPKVPESAGIALLIPLAIATIYGFFIEKNPMAIVWYAVLSGFSLIGFIDDTKHKFSGKKMLPWKARAMAIAALALFAASAFFKEPLAIILASLYIAGLASFQNTFAGLNGWEIGSGFIISGFFALTLFQIQSPLAFAALALNASILGLLMFNKYKAKVFPGDSGTLLIGSAMAMLMVMHRSLHLMAFTLFFFIPHLIDFSLKMLTNPKDPSQKKEPPYVVRKDSKLDVPKSMKLDFAKLIILIFGPMKEWQIVVIIWAIVLVNCSIWFFLLGL